MSSREYYAANKERWAKIYYPAFRKRLEASKDMQARKKATNRECERRRASTKARRYEENKAKFVALLGGACCMCGFDDVRALQFDHIDPSKKSCNLPTYFRYKDLTKAYEESKNCRLLCANCHAIETHKSGRLRIGKTRIVEAA